MKTIPKQRSLNFSLALEDEVLKISLALPISPRQRAKWKSIKDRYYHQPISESLAEQNIINVPVGFSNALDVLTEDSFHQNGDVYSGLSRQTQKALREEAINFIHLYLDPTSKSSEGNPSQFLLNLKTNDPLIHKLALDLVSELKSRGWDCCLSMWGEWATLALHLLRQAATEQQSPGRTVTPGLHRDTIKNVIDYIHSHLDEDLNLAQLASIAKMSLYHFARQFKQSMGVPPHQYVTHCRIEKAKQLLMNRDLPIAEIAHRVGFQSQSHFTNLFRLSVDLTPSAYRNQV